MYSHMQLNYIQNKFPTFEGRYISVTSFNLILKRVSIVFSKTMSAFILSDGTRTQAILWVNFEWQLKLRTAPSVSVPRS